MKLDYLTTLEYPMLACEMHKCIVLVTKERDVPAAQQRMIEHLVDMKKYLIGDD